jgi:hypothetical protein
MNIILSLGRKCIYIGHYFLPIDYVIFILTQRLVPVQGRIQDFKLGGAHLKKLGRAEGGAKFSKIQNAYQ